MMQGWCIPSPPQLCPDGALIPPALFLPPQMENAWKFCANSHPAPKTLNTPDLCNYDVGIQFTVTKKMVACQFYQNALWSEIIEKGTLTSFDEQTEDNGHFSHLCNLIFQSISFTSFRFSSFSYLIPPMHSVEINMPPSFLLR